MIWSLVFFGNSFVVLFLVLFAVEPLHLLNVVIHFLKTVFIFLIFLSQRMRGFYSRPPDPNNGEGSCRGLKVCDVEGEDRQRYYRPRGAAEHLPILSVTAENRPPAFSRPAHTAGQTGPWMHRSNQRRRKPVCFFGCKFKSRLVFHRFRSAVGSVWTQFCSVITKAPFGIFVEFLSQTDCCNWWA